MSAAPQIKDNAIFEVEVTKGPHKGLRLSFAKSSATIGRGPENDIVLANDPRVSRQHAEIKQRGQDFLIVNLSSKNFILLDGVSIQSEVLNQNSVVQIGDTEIHFIKHIAVPAPPSSIPEQRTNLSSMPSTIPKSPFSNSAVASTGVANMPSMPQFSAPPLTPQTGVAYGAGLPHTASSQSRPSSAGQAIGGVSLLQNPRARFYGIIAILGLVAWFVLSPSKNKNMKDPNAIRTSAISLQDVAEAEKRSQELLSLKKDKYDSVQYRRAQENFIRGFRDFQQGQYSRAREAFQVVLNLDPDNELAKRYFHLSRIKFDELVKFNMIQGNRYREKRNWKMCQSNYSNVMTMLQNRKDDPTFKEAKQYYQECSLNVETGRF